MYVGHYSVAGKRLHPLAIKARGKKTRRGRGNEGERNRQETKGEKERKKKKKNETVRRSREEKVEE
jgi:hypothetical protein